MQNPERSFTYESWANRRVYEHLGSLENPPERAFELLDGSMLTAVTSGSGNGGNIIITADSVTIDGTGSELPTGIFTNTLLTGGLITDVNVTLDISHTFDSDIDVFLFSAQGTWSRTSGHEAPDAETGGVTKQRSPGPETTWNSKGETRTRPPSPYLSLSLSLSWVEG